MSLSLLMLVGCGKLLTIEIEESAQTEVPGGTLVDQLVSQLGFSSFTELDVTSNEELQNQGVEPGDIKDVVCTALELEALSGDPDLSFISSLEVHVSGPDLPEELLARQDEFPEGQALVALDLQYVDLTDYVTGQSMTITTQASGSPPSQDTVIEATIRLDVGVTGQGIVGGGS